MTLAHLAHAFGIIILIVIGGAAAVLTFYEFAFPEKRGRR